MASLTPVQQVIKIVNETLTALMGSQHKGLQLSGTKPISIMLGGLQG
jgi:signal recognition particle subunit SRP54